MPHRSTRTTQYSYFDTQFGRIDWSDKKILDYGGNIGGFLVGAPKSIKPENYWNLEVDQGAVEIGQKCHPQAHFHWFDRYNCFDNANGKVGLTIPFEPETFDIIISFSVFTHVSKPDMLSLVEQLKNLLKPKGILGFTFFDTFYDPSHDSQWEQRVEAGDFFKGCNLAHRLSKYPHLDVDALMAQAQGSQWCTLVHDDLRLEPPDDASPVEQAGADFLQFYDSPFLQTLFPEGTIMPPIAPETQHCLVIKKD